MKICQKCGNTFEKYPKIGGMTRNFQRRKYCLDCSPFNKHNTRRLQTNDTLTYNCRTCGETDIEKMMNSEKGRKSKSLCKICHNNNTIKRCQQNKLRAVEHKGGRCFKCEYDKCIAALEFHHLNPDEKDPNFGSMRTWGWDRIKKEIDKCELFCANCHREIHFGLIV